jgi:predicted GNAT superfamily acetyltransferase
LEPRNANLYVDRIGVESTAYLTNFYGPMRDELNKGDESDRILVSWRLDRPERARRGPGYTAGAKGGRDVVDIPEALSVGEGSAPLRGVDAWQEADRFTIRVPRHIRSIRRSDPELAVAWRLEVRRILRAALGNDYRISAASRGGVYCLTRSGVEDPPETAVREPAVDVEERR